MKMTHVHYQVECKIIVGMTGDRVYKYYDSKISHTKHDYNMSLKIEGVVVSDVMSRNCLVKSVTYAPALKKSRGGGGGGG